MADRFLFRAGLRLVSICVTQRVKHQSDEVIVPVLVSSDIVQRPMIEFNAIVEIMRDKKVQVQPSEKVFKKYSLTKARFRKADHS